MLNQIEMGAARPVVAGASQAKRQHDACLVRAGVQELFCNRHLPANDGPLFWQQPRHLLLQEQADTTLRPQGRTVQTTSTQPTLTQPCP